VPYQLHCSPPLTLELLDELEVLDGRDEEVLVDVEVDVREEDVLVATELLEEGVLEDDVAALDELSPLLPA
jgi:hypothetical protein